MKPIAWVLPSLAPASTSRYCAELLLDKLSGCFSIELFSGTGGHLAGVPVAPLPSFEPGRAALLFVNFEAIASEAQLRPLLKQGLRSEGPCVVWFHDLLGEDGLPLLTNEIAPVQCALFSSFRNHAEFRRGVGANWSGTSWHLPYPVRCNEPQEREDLGTIAFMGTPWSESRAEKLFAALSRCDLPQRLVWLIDRSEEEGARRLMELFPDQRVNLEFERSPERWAEVVKHTSVAAHLRVSAVGDPGPYLPISWASGVPTIVSDFAEGEYVQANISARISPGVDEANSLGEAFAKALVPTEAIHAQRSTALDYVREFHHHLSVSAELERLFSRLLR